MMKYFIYLVLVFCLKCSASLKCHQGRSGNLPDSFTFEIYPENQTLYECEQNEVCRRIEVKLNGSLIESDQHVWYQTDTYFFDCFSNNTATNCSEPSLRSIFEWENQQGNFKPNNVTLISCQPFYCSTNLCNYKAIKKINSATTKPVDVVTMTPYMTTTSSVSATICDVTLLIALIVLSMQSIFV